MATAIGTNAVTSLVRHYIMPEIVDNIYGDNPLTFRLLRANKKLVQGGTQILLIEDEPNIAEAIRFILTRAGWNVTVDGEAAKIVEPDGAFLGVQLPAGRHEVRFEYSPPGLKAGAALTLFGLAVCAVVLLWPRWWPVVSPRLRRRDRTRRRGGAEPGDEAGGSTGMPAAAAPD